jgi:hypothetical protein
MRELKDKRVRLRAVSKSPVPCDCIRWLEYTATRGGGGISCQWCPSLGYVFGRGDILCRSYGSPCALHGRPRWRKGTALLRDAQRAFWTRTMWSSEEAMKAFMLSGPHRKAMPKLMDWCNEAALVDWVQESDREPDWNEAHRRLQQQGRRSKVRHPSAAQESYEIPRPEIRPLTSE